MIHIQTISFPAKFSRSERLINNAGINIHHLLENGGQFLDGSDKEDEQSDEKSQQAQQGLPQSTLCWGLIAFCPVEPRLQVLNLLDMWRLS